MNRNPCIGWRHGDLVSDRVGGVERVGKAVSITRRADGQRFWMVDVLGKREWPEGWVLGRGPCLHDCLECGQPYRSADPDQDMCPACMPSTRLNMNHADGTRSIAATLRGAPSQVHRTKPTATDAEIAAQKAADEKELPF